jgi:hypothetical protein
MVHSPELSVTFDSDDDADVGSPLSKFSEKVAACTANTPQSSRIVVNIFFISIKKRPSLTLPV